MENSHITAGGRTLSDKMAAKAKDILCGLRYNECVFYPFGGFALFAKASIAPIDESLYIKVKNPIGEDLSVMNRSLAPNMLQCIALNLARKNTNLRMFEVGSPGHFCKNYRRRQGSRHVRQGASASLRKL